MERILSSIECENHAIVKLLTNLRCDAELQAHLRSVVETCSSSVRNGGRLFFVGVGKSAIVADKISRTSSSLNVPATAVPAVDLIHGDAGGLRSGDVVFFISNSGSTVEAVRAAACARLFGCFTISVCAVTKSTLSQTCHLGIWFYEHRESDHLGFAPTSSVLASIALLDGIVNAVSAELNVSVDDFSKAHPGGSLGRVFWGPSFLRYVDAGQAHVFDGLNVCTQPKLLIQLQTFDIDEQVLSLQHALAQGEAGMETLKPFLPVIPRSAFGDRAEQYNMVGRDLVTSGQVGVLILAGGNASRMGITFPKALLDIGLPSKRTLLQIQMEQIYHACLEAGMNQPKVPICIVINEENRAEIELHLAEHNWFNFIASDFYFCTQPNMLCFDETGKVIISPSHLLLTAPNGHGGMYEALFESGTLEALQKRGVNYLLTSCVDNPLTITLDAQYVGYCHVSEADMGFKVVKRRAADEPAGVVCTRNGRACYMEYSELPPSLGSATREDGSLLFSQANTLNLLLRIDLLFLLGQNRDILPYHVARKMVSSLSGPIRGVKLERFAPDACKYAGKVVLLEVERAKEFSPVKNAFGSKYDSPETAVMGVHACSLCRLQQLGLRCDAKLLEVHSGASDAILAASLAHYCSSQQAPDSSVYIDEKGLIAVSDSPGKL